MRTREVLSILRRGGLLKQSPESGRWWLFERESDRWGIGVSPEQVKVIRGNLRQDDRFLTVCLIGA